MTKIKNYLLGYKNMYIMQDTDFFNFSLDSVLLANFVTLNKNITKIMDIGTGNAPIPLILSTKTNASIDAIEIQEDLYNLALESIIINNKEDQINVINEDINKYYKELESDIYDIITCNPPYFKYTEASNKNMDEHKTIARHEIKLDLEQLFKICKKILKNNGVVSIVHRPERFVEIIEIMKKNNIEPKRVQFIYPKKNKEANILLIEGVKNGKPGLKIEQPLFSHNENGDYTEEIQIFFE